MFAKRRSDEATNQRINESTNQRINESTNQRINDTPKQRYSGYRTRCALQPTAAVDARMISRGSNVE
ncbi:hypothetical protein DIE00_33315 [Burkholderia sp. Bp8989]|nr:hypothetical protein DIE00_33315 [Burkholderia sp. Bp8989]